jgi:4-phosphopantoate--beta-alanine ligase
MTMNIPKSHPRYASLMAREKIKAGHKDGIVAEAGLIAQGRGEAFDYILGERTHKVALATERAAVIAMMLARNPVISVNGNVAALVADDAIRLARAIPAKVEINLFYRTPERMRRIGALFRKKGYAEVLGLRPDAKVPGLESKRANCTKAGIFGADVVLVPLEDGDRAEALKKMGKFVITVDLNPFSRTARAADITIVDNIVRAMPNMADIAQELAVKKTGRGRRELEAEMKGFSNERNISRMIGEIITGLSKAADL